MKVFILCLALMIPAWGDTAKTTLSPAAQETMAKIAYKISGTIKAQKPHGYLVTMTPEITITLEKNVFLLTEAKLNIGDTITNVVVYPMGRYSYPTNDTGTWRL